MHPFIFEAGLMGFDGCFYESKSNLVFVFDGAGAAVVCFAF